MATGNGQSNSLRHFLVPDPHLSYCIVLPLVRRACLEMDHTFKILIVGGYGTFGGRTVELLEDEPGLTLVVAGRSLDKARSFCLSRKTAKAALQPAAFDRARNIARQLEDIRPDIVLDASGPFQNYGQEAYGLIEACIAAGIHYLDLADGSEFVAGVSSLDSKARDAQVFVLSGLSSFPVLTSAVVRRLSSGMEKVTSIRGGIAPSPYAGVGGNVIRAIASYSGQELNLVQAGKPVKMWPLTSSLRYTIAPPGYLPLRNIRFSLVDVPDLRVLGNIWPDATIWMGAGPMPEILHRMLNLFAWLVRRRVLKSLLPMSGLMEFVTRHVRWGDDRGGMFVEVKGLEHGQPVTRSWHLLAEGRDGPLIPSMAVEAIVRKLLAGEKIRTGARAALGDVTLEDYEKLFSRRTIFTGMRQDAPRSPAPLFRQVLGSAWEKLPAPIREMHDVTNTAVAEGIATIERGGNPLGSIACWLLRFPAAARDVPVQVRFDVRDSVEKWTRTFGGHSFHSRLGLGHDLSEQLFTERFGIISFAMALVLTGDRLHLVLRRWSILGIPLPMWLCVKSDSYEFVDAEGRFNFNVRISHPLTGMIVHYRGWLLRKP